MRLKLLGFVTLLIWAASLAWAQAAPRKVVYAFDKAFPPFTFLKKKKPVGFEVDLLKAALKNSGYQVLFQPGQWDAIQKGLAAGRVQITSGMAKTASRAKKYYFAVIANAGIEVRFFVRARSKYRCLADLAGKTVATQKGSYYHRLLVGRGVKLKLFPDEFSALRALLYNRAAAFLGAGQTAYYNLDKLGIKRRSVVSMGTPLKVTRIYFAVSRRAPGVALALNLGLARLKATGEYNRIFRRWFVKKLTPKEIALLTKAAKRASVQAYAPYSRFRVGAAVLTGSGAVYTGCNIENALFSQTVSAVKVAVFKAVSAGDPEIRAVVNLAPDGSYLAPAAGGRQVLNEFAPGALVVLKDIAGRVITKMASELLPRSFDLRR